MSAEIVGIIGLGYVGLPVAVALAKSGLDVRAYDRNAARIEELCAGIDRTREVSEAELRSSGVSFGSDASILRDVSCFIITVPTPIDESRRPDLSYLRAACETVGAALKPGGLVIIESTVYPGITEEFCAPIIEARSGLRASKDFMLGYSPERINPGDAARSFADVVKVIAADSPEALARVASIYERAAKAGLHHAPSIKAAEASKLLENTQRDLNIALMNELALICDRLGIPTRDVIEAASTKWNFLPFKPGLVGGHCIGVDPYYLTACAEQHGHHPEMILAGRRINDAMGRFVAQKCLKLLVSRGVSIAAASIGVFGITFKENIPDLRNSRVHDLVSELKAYGARPLIVDPVAERGPAEALYGELLVSEASLPKLDALIFTTPHRHFIEEGELRLASLLREGGVLLDVRAALDPKKLPQTIEYWSL